MSITRFLLRAFKLFLSLVYFLPCIAVLRRIRSISLIVRLYKIYLNLYWFKEDNCTEPKVPMMLKK